MSEKLAKMKTRRLPPLLRRAWYGLNQAFPPRAARIETRKVSRRSRTRCRCVSERHRHGKVREAFRVAPYFSPTQYRFFPARMKRWPWLTAIDARTGSSCIGIVERILNSGPA